MRRNDTLASQSTQSGGERHAEPDVHLQKILTMRHADV